MTALKVFGQVDQSHRLSAVVPESIRPGPVEILLIAPTREKDDAGTAWAESVAREWHEELSDPREDIYTLADGEPVDDPR